MYDKFYCFIFNSLGERVHSQTAQGHEIEINCSALAAGIDLLTIKTPNHKVVEKLIKL